MTTNFILQSAVKFPVSLWIEAPPFAYQGCSATDTFKIYMYSEDNNPHTIHLYAQGSNSIPYQNPQNKWSHLNPQWRFLDTKGNVINDLILDNAIVTTFNGTTGYLTSAEFIYIDDMPSYVCETILIWAVADYFDYTVEKDLSRSYENVPGYSNSKVIAVAPYIINELTPEYLNITRDGINPLFDFYWKNSVIPYVVTVMGKSPDGQITILKNVPPTNILGVSGENVIRSIPNLPVSALTWTPDNANALLSSLDYQYFNVGGYLKGSVVSTDDANNVTIQAKASTYYHDILDQWPYLWVSNPENNTINRIFAPCLPDKWLTTDLPFSLEMSQSAVNISVLQVTMPPIMGVSGFHGIYGMAMDENKNLWCTDAESDKVYKFDSNGVLLSTINFGENNAFGWVTGGCTPAGISIDGQNNIWVTFFDSVSTIYLNGIDGSIIKTIRPEGYLHEVPPYIDPLFKPVLAEPDKDNNVWITYHNTICSALIKYDNSGNLITSITLPTCSNPMDIHITQDKGLWVSLTYQAGPPYNSGEVRKYSSTYGLLCSIPAVNPAYIALDKNENLWFTQSGNVLTRVTSGGNITNWNVGMGVPSVFNRPPHQMFLDSALEGLCCDIYNRIFVINSLDNKVYTIVGDKVGAGIKITPDQNLAWYNDGGTIYATATGGINKSVQAFGDWSGSRWHKKYGMPENVTTKVVYIAGDSNPFNIYDFKGYDIRRFNESWDSINEIKFNIKQRHINENPTFWDEYMGALWGSAASEQGEGFGREAYEKIANFVSNHIDVNTCNVNQLYSLAKFVDVPIDVYGTEFPPELRRLMDIGSVNQQNLWGSRCYCKQNINNEYVTYSADISGIPTKIPINYKCDVCDHYHPGNRGELFDPHTYMVTANVPFIVEDRTKTNNKYQLITPPASCGFIVIDPEKSIVGDFCVSTTTNFDCLTTYPLSSYYHILLPKVFDYGILATFEEFEEAQKYFCFYEYIPVGCNQQVTGIINWDDSYTTISENISSIEDWYGDGQIFERMINYVLYKGLGLIN